MAYVGQKLRHLFFLVEEFLKLHKKIKKLRHEILAHHSGQSLKVNHTIRNEKECVDLNENRITTFLLDKDEFKTFELLCSRIYGLIQFEDPLTIPLDEIEDMIYGFQPL